MPTNEITTWLGFTLQQMAAESYLDGIANLDDRNLIRDRLLLGNNHPLLDPDVRGTTRFPDSLATRFLDTYRIVSHHANDSTGFSATLIQERGTNNYTLSFRSTEYQNQVDGGDWERDGLFAAPLTFAADGEIGADGFAFGQLAAMENYYLELTTSGKLPVGATLNVTGYSLGGHLATIFTELHANDSDIVFGHTYTFNGAGRGHIAGPGATEAARIDGMLDLLREVLFNPDAGVSHVVNGFTNPRYLAAAGLVGQPFTPFTSETTLGGAGNIYTDARYRWAVEVATMVYDTDRAQTSPGEVGTSPDFGKITQLYGLATTGDLNVVANSGVHASAIPVFIEGQPQIEGVLLFQDKAAFGNTHAITLLVDSLAIQELIQTIDPRYGQASAELLIKAASNTRAQNLAPLNTLDVVESDSLEKTVDAFRKLLRDPALPAASPLPVNSRVGGFGDLGNRNVMYAAIQEIKDRVAALQAQQPGLVFTIDDLTNPTLSSPALAGIADTDTDQGLAYRYALKELNPFAVIANTAQANSVLYQGHNAQGQLDRFNTATGIGTLTAQYLTDRALFLKEKIALNQLDQATSSGNIHFKDFAPNGLEITTTVDLRVDQEFLFGSDGDEGIGVLVGNSKDDHLYGGGGNDLLEGGDGRDYLQGDAGIDRLDGGEQADTMAGGAGDDFYIVDNAGDEVIEGLNNGKDRVESSVSFSFSTGDNLEDLTLTGTSDINGTGNELDNLITGNDSINRLDGKGGTDHLIGGIGNDILSGGAGNNDLLEGGAGFDTYIYNAGDGIDQIEDSDATGKIVFNGGLLQGGISTDGGATYVSLDGTESYILSGGHLIVNGVLTVNADFQSGQFGIQLRDVSEANYDNGYPDIVRVGTPAADTFGILGLVNNIIHYGGGDDVDIGERGNDQLFGEEGHDVLEGNTGDDRLSGGAGNDVLRGDNVTAPGPAFNLGTDAVWGRDVLDGGDGDDTLIGDWGDDILRGGADADLLYGDSLSAAQGTASANDFLDGGDGNDELHGQEGDDVLYGGTGNDVLSGEAGDDVEDGGAGNDLLLASIGNDSLAGGAGIDQLYGDQDNDSLDGGDDADTLHGGDGTDSLFGGAGDDVLFGDGLNNPSELSATGGADFLEGGAGNDHLEGGIGDDTLFGGTENDVLFGDEGADVLAGDDGDDELQGGVDDDTLFGDAGADRLFGQAGDDELAGGEGNDLLVGGDGHDFLDGEEGMDRLEGGTGQDILAGGAGNDTLLGEADDDQLFGDEGDDVLNGGAGNNLLFGGEGNDQLIGGSGIDRLEGGTGNDTLVGGGGADTIIYDGQGQDILTADANDRLELTNGLTSTTVLAGRTVNNLVLTISGTADRLTVQSFFASPVNQMSQLRFADGTVWDTATIVSQSSRILLGTEGNDVLQTPDGLGYTLHGFGGNDVLFGGGGLDTVDGGAGLDLLRGGAGADTLLGGEGNDSLEGEDGDDVLIGGTGDDQLHGGAGADQLFGGDGDDSMTGDADDILLDGGTGLDRIFFQGSVGVTFDLGAGHFEYANATDGHDTLTAASVVDAVQLFGNSGDDQLTGGFGNDLLAGGDGTDILWGGAGADQLEGGAGADTYLFGLGDGHDGILDSAVVDGSADDEDGGGGGGPTIEQNRVVFGAGILSDALRLSFDPILSSLPGSVGTLQLTVNTTDAILLSNFDPSDPFGSHAIETFEFADGTSLTYAQLVARGFDLTGTEGGDTIVGTILADRISGLHGEDVLRAGFGNDQLDGGTGNDQLLGGFGHDTYVFADSSGQDLLFDPAGHDTVRMGEGIAAEDIQGTREGHDLVLIVQSTGDSLRLQHFYLGETFQVEDVRFADGTVWDRARLLVSTQRQILGTDGIDVLTGGPPDDLISGFAGNDTLLGLAGTDLLDGGTGADTMAGGSGDDTYVVDDAGDVVTEQLNEGADTIHSSITYQLGSNVEHLTLAGSGNVDGTGNQLDNVLIGNSAANVFTGGTGNDTYMIGAGDTVVEQVNEGMDTVVTDQSYTLGTYVEHLTLTGSGNVKGTGNALDNVLTGNSGTNVLTGGAGSDIYVIGVGDTVVEASNEGNDTVMTDHSYTLGVDVEQLTLTGNQAINGTGNELDNVLQGNRSINVLAGGLGNDLYLVGLGDIVLESAGEGTDTIQTAQSYTLGAHLEHLTLLDGPHPALAVSLTPDTGIPAEVGPSINFTGTGNELDNHLLGNRADNVLEGQGGSDVLDGGAGNDTLKGGEGADTYLFGLGSGHDRIDDQSLAGEIDTIRLAPGILPTQIGVVQSGMDLVLRMPGSRDELALGNFFHSSASAKKIVQFEDGTVWNEATLRALGADPGPGIFFTDPGNVDVLAGTTGNDELRGTSGNDTITGGAGHDILRDNTGSNVLDGGAGDDQLFGSSGNDIFVFGRGYGHDAVFVDQIFFGGPLGFLWSDLLTTDTDSIQMVGLHPDDVTIQRQTFQSGQAKFTITVLDSADQLTLWFRNGTYGFAPAPVTLQFADGSSQALGLTSSFPAAPSPTVLSSVNYTLNGTQENLILLDLNSSVISNPGIGTGNALDNVLLGNTADNLLDGGAGNDVVNGGFPRSVENQLFIDTGSDVLLGGEGDDLLIPFGDVVFGFEIGVGGDPNRFNTPDDVLLGGPGHDTYLIRHAGQIIGEREGEGIDMVHSPVSYTLSDHVENLVLIPTAIDDDLGLPGLIGTGNTLDNVLIGGGGEDLLIGGAGHDTLYGGSARSGGDIDDDGIPDAVPVNDTLVGGTGHDTYVFNVGDGLDTIDDTVTVGEGNRIQFGLDIGQSDLTFVHDEAARTLMIQVGNSGIDQLRLINFDPTNANGSLVVETLAFANGSTASLATLLGLGGPVATNGDDTITTGAGDDTVDALGGNDTVNTGAGNDTITGGTGNDQLIGGAGDDTYLFNLGDGVDTITDTAAPGEGNTVEFGTGIAPTDLSLGVGSLLIRVGANGDAIHLTNFDPANVLGPRTIESFRFADGRVLSYDQLVARGFDLTGTAGHDTITGTNVVDRINGLAGDDTIQAGAGDDLLSGGAGGDTYLYNLGDGLDTIDDTAAVGAGNRIQFGTGISQAGLTFTRDEVARTLTIDVGGNGADKLVLTNFDPTGANGSHVVEGLAFTDGSSVNLVDLYPPNHAPTVTTPLADQTVSEDVPLSLVVPANTFADQDAADVLTYSASLADGTALPAWLSFDATTATFSGTPDDAQVGTLDLNVTATDRGNLSVSDVFTLAVTNVNEAPTVAMPLADQQAAEDASFNFVVPANIFADVDHVHGDQLAYRATLSDGSELPSWLNFDSATRTFSGTPLNGDVGILNIDITATDGGALSVTDSFALTVQNVNDAPTVAAPLSDQTAAEDSAFIFTVSSGAFTDEDLIHGDVLTYSATLADGSALPTWLGFDPTTRTFSGTPGAADVGTIYIAVTATDTEALSGTALFTVNVTRPLPQTVVGTTGNDVLTGGRGDDTLSGLAGHDLLDGDEGSDRMLGGAGSDTYVVDASGDVVVELPNEGFDTVIADITTALSANVEALVLTGLSAIDGTGNSLNNSLTGNNASNTLDGGSGADVMAGLDGGDTYIVDRSSDLAVELANHGIDTVQSAVTYALAANLEHLTLTGAAAINGTGNALDNVLVGNSAANRLTGGAGNDTYVVGAGDTVVESSNSGTDTVHSSVTWTLGSNLEHLTLTGSSAINGTGNSAANVLTGNSANNVLNGANGADTLRGGLGNDTVNGGGGNDTFLFGRGDGQDFVQDNSGAADKLLYDAGINPLDLVISRQANDLRLAIHGSPDQVTVQNWYAGTSNRIETLQAGNGQTLLSTQVDQLIQAMAGFTAQTGLTWDQAIDQRPQEVQTVLAASWQ